MIEIERDGAVQVIRLNRPSKKNALTGEMYEALAGALEAGNADDGIRAHLLLGVPGAFTSGNDIGDFLGFAMSGGGMQDAPVVRFLRALGRCEVPIVAGVDGLAIGVGTTLLFHCDMIFASPRAVFRTPFLDLGLVPEAGASLLAPRAMGHARAFELLCLGEPFDPVQAKAAGFVNHIVAEEELEPRARAAAQAIAAKAGPPKSTSWPATPERLAVARDALLHVALRDAARAGDRRPLTRVRARARAR